MEHRKKIMVVEDQPVLLDLYLEKFRNGGYEALGCGNGLEAVTKLDSFRPDAVLLDVMMPQMDGFETLRVMRKLAPSIRTKILVFSNLSGQEHVDRCLALGADGYLVKAETTPGEVFRKVDGMLDRGGEQETPEPVDPEEDTGILAHCPCCGTRFRVAQEKGLVSE